APDRPDAARRVADHADVNGRVVHVVLDALAEDEPDSDHVVLSGVEIRSEIDAPAGGTPRQVELIGQHVVVLDGADDAAGTYVAPAAGRLEGGGDVGNGEARLDVLQFDA